MGLRLSQSESADGSCQVFSADVDLLPEQVFRCLRNVPESCFDQSVARTSFARSSLSSKLKASDQLMVAAPGYC